MMVSFPFQSTGKGWLALCVSGLLISTLVLIVVLGNVAYDSIFTGMAALIVATTHGVTLRL
jgi:hypothetical protein